MAGVLQEIQFAMDQAAIEQLIAESARQGERIGRKMTEAIGEGGKDKARTTAVDIMAQLSRELERNESRVKEALARGLISPDAASRAAAANAQAYNAGILKAMDQLRAKGALTNEAFINMTKELKNVGAASSEIDKTSSSVSKLHGFLAKAGGLLAGFFAFRKITLFGKESIEEWKQDEAALNRLDSALNRMGTSATALAIPLRQLEGEMRRLRLDEDETQEILGTLVGRTNQVKASFENVALVVALARREHMDFASASQIVANLMNGNVMRLRQLGINATNAKDAMAELRRETAGEGEKWAQTLEGRLRGLNVLWLNFKSAVGQAMIEAGGGTSVIDTLSAAIQTMTTWVTENSDKIVDMKDAVVEVAGAVIDLGRDISNLDWTGFGSGIEKFTMQLNKLDGNLTQFAGNIQRVFGRQTQLLSFGKLGAEIVAAGDRLIAEGKLRVEQAESDYRAAQNRRVSRGIRTEGPQAGESIGTGGAGSTLPVGPGGGGGRDALKDAADRKRLAAEAKQQAEEIRKAHEQTIQNAIKMVEAQVNVGDALFILRGAEMELKTALDEGNLTIQERTTKLLELADVQAAIRSTWVQPDIVLQKGADKATGVNQPNIPGPIGVTEDQAQEIRDTMKGIDLTDVPASMPSIGHVFDDILGNMRDNSEDVADSIADNFSEAFEQMKKDGFSVNSVLSNLGKGMAKSIIGEIQKIAKSEAMMSLANAIKFTAIGIGQSALGNLAGAGKSFAAAALHAKSAVAWGLLAGGVGSMGGGGGGGNEGGGSSGSVERTSSIDSAGRSGGSEIHIWLDPIDAKNSRHQEVIGEAQRRYMETTGGKIIYHSGAAG
jgi:hypothetical protein